MKKIVCSETAIALPTDCLVCLNLLRTDYLLNILFQMVTNHLVPLNIVFELIKLKVLLKIYFPICFLFQRLIFC